MGDGKAGVLPNGEPGGQMGVDAFLFQEVEFVRFRGHPIMLSAGVIVPHILSV